MPAAPSLPSTSSPAPPPGVAVVEIAGLTVALAALDAMEKAAAVRLLQAELNDLGGVVIKVRGDSARLRAAVAAAAEIAERMHAPIQTTLLDTPDTRGWSVIESPPEHQPLLNQDAVFIPTNALSGRKATTMTAPNGYAIGLIETQGFAAVIEAIDTACKAADVHVIGKEKLGGGYVTVVIRGDVAAVTAAVEAGRQRVEGLGRLIAAHVIARPSESVLSLFTRA